ncbi:hypothetical protein PTKIN_Ptkin17bG0070200 [Pterospermum kingtungense]
MELYKCRPRKLLISQTILDEDGKPTVVYETLKIDIEPGWNKGTEITFAEKRNHEAGVTPTDVVFLALTGITFRLTTFDGRFFTIPVADIVESSQQLVIPYEGMPMAKQPLRSETL